MDEGEQEQITSITTLIDELDNSKEGHFGAIVSRIAIPPKDLEEFVSYSKKKYTRTCLNHNDDYELLLLGWEPNQKTPIHGHGDQDCWVHVVKGSFEERLYHQAEDSLELVRISKPEVHDTTFMDDDMGYHCLENQCDTRAISLHLYAQPIRHCQVFDESSNIFNEVEMIYDKEVDLAVFRS